MSITSPEYRAYAQAERDARQAEAKHRQTLYTTGRMALKDRPGCRTVRYAIPAQHGTGHNVPEAERGKHVIQHRQGWLATVKIGNAEFDLVAQADRLGKPAAVVHHASGMALGAKGDIPAGRSIRLRLQAHVDKLVERHGAEKVRAIIDAAPVINP